MRGKETETERTKERERVRKAERIRNTETGPRKEGSRDRKAAVGQGGADNRTAGEKYSGRSKGRSEREKRHGQTEGPPKKGQGPALRSQDPWDPLPGASRKVGSSSSLLCVRGQGEQPGVPYPREVSPSPH